MILKNCTALIDGKLTENILIEFENDKIIRAEAVEKDAEIEEDSVDMGGMIVSPGFIDQHVHGAVGYDFMDGSEEAITSILEALAREGVTSILAATTTGTNDDIVNALDAIKDFDNAHGVEILGIHLEGPYLSPEAPGAHRKELLAKPTVESFRTYQNEAGGKISMITLAVEEDEGFELTKYLRQHGVVVSIGHSNASYDQTLEAIEAGCQCATHCYNAMKGLHHRDAGVVGAALLTKGFKAELIVDRIHVSDPAICVFDKMKSSQDKILITDAMRAKGLCSGTYDLGGQQVYSNGIEVRTKEGALAGSVLTMDRALKNYMDVTGRRLEEVLLMMTKNPAELQQVYDRKGSISVGKDADLVVLDKELKVQMTICRGKVVYSTNHENNSC
ncbi:N-acetylglucosamine-6-phosphate deacetylase [Dethiosulfatibacter aminovorans DSM 17477]|uniref:N-acetylglucosamine-6-phosphate deacetylase n=1 Tax=Dethiosulfatibacter aminovorans DSM 17477 TaxID=1121476 RepID=A0A1M6E634_9FIRM|nr:N-acetylglucosamine-6-phosphate deacetylase [Dethiosulfatibacter aminovorans]SHI80966.1 N-acetylglucosamine-6-phosphate deacetylase [Dethiosulfatibacter aminovorans DSM 17477]